MSNETTITDIIGSEQEQELRNEFYDLLESGCDYDDVEELFLDYALEMDYLLDIV